MDRDALRFTLERVGHTNRTYADAEVQVIKAALSDAEASMQRLEEVALNRQLHHKGKAQLAKLTAEIERYKIALAPLKTLSLELLHQIFQFCGSLEVPLDTTAKPINTLPVVALTQVCSAWRRIVLNTPVLWCVVHAGGYGPRAVALAREWLSRAGNIPRSLTVKNAVALVEPELSKFPFRKLDVMLSSCGNFIVASFPPQSLVPLEELFINYPSYTVGQSLPFDAASARLVVLHLGKLVSVDDRHFRKLLSMQNLRELVISALVTASQCLGILRQLARIEIFSLTLHSYPDGMRWDGGGVIAPNLSRFVLRSRSAITAAIVLDQLAAPSLSSLSLGEEGSEMCRISISDFRSWAQRSEFELKELILHIDPCDLCPGGIDEIHMCTPSLQHLTICCPPEIPNRATMLKLGSGKIWPRLRTLTLVGAGRDVCPVLSMIERRQKAAGRQDNAISSFTQVSCRTAPPTCQTTPVTLPETPPLTKKNQRRVAKLEADGLELHLQYA